ncbi:hypothetical protein COY90_05120 [Candidatus Roizmanbacteria bacterium CG_4_10_14_0_8_um_filter_39_9]|uniref:Uncharacterized protein n=1 Tax=Candidatus Roizmanbacteria bacterium CG_4_10_14_0_8_um_filter_39_9 TaxID=1974829 RepID=A0A2M7QCJ8_9BACT|nr:MAG: hypothetical protein COY90_05120 [Candidatus Roizmanbacteria bacterium CG_4_10_14_0_8_um_filter_39_9]
MNNTISVRKIRYFIKDYWGVIATVVSLSVVALLVFSVYASYKQTNNNLEIIVQEVALLKNRTDALRYNKALTEDQITTYNQILTMLIPETEDYFSIIYALDEISTQTGFNIVGYTVDFLHSTREKITITVEGRGNIDSFLNFLQNYQFEGGRLVTSEKIQFSGSVTTTKVSLNFYNKKFTFNESVVPQLNKKDLDRLESIKQKISVSFKNGSAQPQEYETKNNPF